MANQDVNEGRSFQSLPMPEDESFARVDSTMPLPQYMTPNGAAHTAVPTSTQRSRTPGGLKHPKDSDRGHKVNGCFMCLGGCWDSLVRMFTKCSAPIAFVSIIGFILLLAAIPFFIFMIQNGEAPAFYKNNNEPLTKNITSQLSPSDERGNSNNLDILLGKILPPRINSCSGFGFNCNNEPDRLISNFQRCDGRVDCSDGSDEQGCGACHTGFSCLSAENPDVMVCLRGTSLCDGITHCKDNSDEITFCAKKTCAKGEFLCEQSNMCVPMSYRCDGDIQCKFQEDEAMCDSCENGAIFCNATKLCIPKWNICDGISQCPGGEDEKNCMCGACSGNDRVLCGDVNNVCILSKNVCNGRSDCPNGEDEEDCPGSCSVGGILSNDTSLVSALKKKDHVTCNDGKEYLRKFACSGILTQCNGICQDSCDKELAHTCNNGDCIQRKKVCDGTPDCSDGEDELDCGCDAETSYQCKSKTSSGFGKCIGLEKRCDGYEDCPGGDDEKECEKCSGVDSFHCKSTNQCLSSIERCDGIAQCPDQSDEMNCECAECQAQPFAMYMCSNSKRCFRTTDVCAPQTRCPSPSNVDKRFCLGSSSAFIAVVSEMK
uniref:EGF-like domain-containing protein n=1 Tax=Rhabditophanes sp. KR3021 TaxID=114890 RepID=A0AC35UI09_9BILA